MVGLEIMPIGDAHHTIKNFRGRNRVTVVIEETTDTTQQVVRDIGTITVTTGETAIEVKVMIEKGVDH